MVEMPAIEAFERGVADAATPAELWQMTAAYFQGSDVTRVIYLHFPPVGAPDDQVRATSSGFPEEQVARYIAERLYRDNPVLRYAQQHIDPVYWDEIEQLSPLSEREAAYLREMAAAGLGNGVGIPVYGPNGRSGQCGLGFRPGVRRLSPALLTEYQWVCQFAHLRYCAMLAEQFPQPELTRRETEVLGWVARGKSNGAIGSILGISAHTVDAHLRRIYVKLGVFDRISAAVRGIGVGLIHSEV